MAVRLAVLLLLAPQALSTNSTGATGTVYVIRHGEKLGLVGCLSYAGHSRAHNLPRLFTGQASTADRVLQIPTSLFAFYYGDLIDCERTYQTIQPISESLGVSIDATHGGASPGLGHGGGNAGAADAIRASLANSDGPVLVAWEHLNIQYLTQELGVAKDAIPSWADSDYDSIYEISLNNGVVSSFSHGHQNFEPQPYAGKWEVTEHRTCWPGIQRGTCQGSTIEECQAECAADSGCGGFNWPHKHLKGMPCTAVLDYITDQTLYVKADANSAVV